MPYILYKFCTNSVQIVELKFSYNSLKRCNIYIHGSMDKYIQAFGSSSIHSAKKVRTLKMVAFFMFILSVSSLSALPLQTESACHTLKRLEQSLNIGILCQDSQPRSKLLSIKSRYSCINPFPSCLAECTTAYLKIVNKCVSRIEVDDDCLKQLYEVCSCENVTSVKGTDNSRIPSHLKPCKCNLKGNEYF